jgi:hypothetical protein
LTTNHHWWAKTRGEDSEDNGKEGLSTLDEESSSNGKDNVPLLRDPPAATVIVIVP